MKKKLSHALKNPLNVVFLTIFIDLLGVGILLPILPQLIDSSIEENILPNGWTVSQGAVLLGWLIAAYPISQFIAAPLLGQLSDRFGRRPVLAISLFGTAVGYALFALGIITNNILLLFLSRIIDGLTGGDIAVAQAVISDVSTESNRAKNFGLAGMVFGLGLLSGPAIGGLLSNAAIVDWFGLVTPFWFAAGLSLLNSLLVLFVLPETLKVKIRQRLNVTQPFHNVVTAFSRPGLRSIMPSSFLFMAGFTFFTTFFGVMLMENYGFTASNTGIYFVYFGIWIAAVQGVVAGIVAKRYADFEVLRVSMFITAIGLLGFMLIPHEIIWLLVVPPLIALGNGLTLAFNSSIIGRITAKNKQGEAFGINSSVMALAQSFPAIIAGYIYSISQDIMLLAASALVAIGGIAFWVLFKPGRDDVRV